MWQDHNLLRTDSATQASYPSHFKQKMCTSLLGKWPTTHTQGLIHWSSRSFHWTTEFSQADKGAALFLQWSLQPKAGTKQDSPRSMVWAWSGARRKCSVIFQHFVAQNSIEDMAPHPLHLMHQMYNGCEDWFSAQVRMWGPPQRTAQILLHHPHLPEMDFLALGIF